MREDGQARRWLAAVPAAARTWPFTMTLTATVTAVGVLSGTVWRERHADIVAAIGTDLDALLRLRWHRFLLSPLYQSDPGIGWSMVLTMLLFVGLLEYAAGSWRAAVTFLTADLVGSAGGILLLAALGQAGWAYAHHAARTADVGSSTGVLGCAAAAAALAPGRWRWVALAALYGSFLLPSVGWFSFETWLGHLIGSVAATALAWGVWRRGQVRVPAWPLPGWKA